MAGPAISTEIFGNSRGVLISGYVSPKLLPPVSVERDAIGPACPSPYNSPSPLQRSRFPPGERMGPIREPLRGLRWSAVGCRPQAGAPWATTSPTEAYGPRASQGHLTSIRDSHTAKDSQRWRWVPGTPQFRNSNFEMVSASCRFKVSLGSGLTPRWDTSAKFYGETGTSWRARENRSSDELLPRTPPCSSKQWLSQAAPNIMKAVAIQSAANRLISFQAIKLE